MAAARGVFSPGSVISGDRLHGVDGHGMPPTGNNKDAASSANLGWTHAELARIIRPVVPSVNPKPPT